MGGGVSLQRKEDFTGIKPGNNEISGRELSTIGDGPTEVVCPFIRASENGMPASRWRLEMRSTTLSSNSEVIFSTSPTLPLFLLLCYISLFNLPIS